MNCRGTPVCADSCSAAKRSLVWVERGVGGWGNILPAWSWQGELPDEPTRTMNLSAQALHTVTIVFFDWCGPYDGGAAKPIGQLFSLAFFRIALFCDGRR